MPATKNPAQIETMKKHLRELFPDSEVEFMAYFNSFEAETVFNLKILEKDYTNAFTFATKNHLTGSHTQGRILTGNLRLIILVHSEELQELLLNKEKFAKLKAFFQKAPKTAGSESGATPVEDEKKRLII